MTALREKAIKENLIPPTYTGEIFQQGCYLYLPIGGPRIKIPSSLSDADKCEKRFPSVYIIGVKKSGTTTLGRYLDLHESLVLANNVRFVANNGSTVEQFVQQYLADMPFAMDDQTTVVNYPGYYWTNRKPFFKALPHLPPNPKIIAILRNPAKRALSDYLHMELTRIRNTKLHRHVPPFAGDDIKPTFENTVLLPNGSINASLAFVQQGLYAKHLSAFLEYIPKERILLLSGDEFAKNPLPSLKRVEQFLGLKSFYKDNYFVYNEEKGFFCAEIPTRPDWTCAGKFKGRSHPNVSEEVILKLAEFYKPHNRRLATQFNLSRHSFDWID
ncbi:Heparan sulfate glucosamine 3-O-sulfotransferase 3A1 [Holothuria leucospilota]|uniref:Heparan sulfate glucosamine 3-O-sulfotransferase 3A1 n=1 Tax=Holothuria leucospilota TaxID=206669 RepID=A0A9Q1HF28_HOLLE|nr:Heparan sulfate glucosamine 3-O-sulfotransferase 3A1 [Holothuria leucospilota]